MTKRRGYNVEIDRLDSKERKRYQRDNSKLDKGGLL